MSLHRMARDWKAASRSLKEKLLLKSDPVGVALHCSAEGHGSPTGETTICHMLMRSRHDREGGVLQASTADMGCVWGSSALGLTRSPERLKGGMLYLGFVGDLAAGASMHASMGMIGDEGRPYQALSTFPLDLAPVDPDAVVLYLTPGRALRLLIAALHLEGGAIQNPMTGQASVCAALSRALKDGTPSLDIPCIGDRSMGLVGDDELVMVFPAAQMDSLLTGLERSEYMAQYPYRPNSSWAPKMPPLLTPLPDELD